MEKDAPRGDGEVPAESEFAHEGLDPPKVWTDWDERLGVYTRAAPAGDRTPPALGGRYRGTSPPIDPSVRGRPAIS